MLEDRVTVVIPIKFGPGPPFRRAVKVQDSLGTSSSRVDQVRFSALMDSSAQSNTFQLRFAETGDLITCLDRHLTELIDRHFACLHGRFSDIAALDQIYDLYGSYRQSDQVREASVAKECCPAKEIFSKRQEVAAVMLQSLKLLVLVQERDAYVDVGNPDLQHAMSQFVGGRPNAHRLDPYYIRLEIRKVVPQLAKTLLCDTLQRLLQVSLTRQCDHHPVVLAVSILLMRTSETIMHMAICHSPDIESCRTGSASLEDVGLGLPIKSAVEKVERGAVMLQNIYRACYENCHRLQIRSMDERHFTGLVKTFGQPAAQLLAALAGILSTARDYIEKKADDVLGALLKPHQVFDRHVARLLLLQGV